MFWAERVTERVGPVHCSASSSGYAASLIADARREKEGLNWRLRLGSLVDIIGAALRWHDRFTA